MWLTIIVIASALFVYIDALSKYIGKLPGRNKFADFNYSAGMWSFLVLLLWIVVFPIYLIKRNSLIKLAKESPVVPKQKGLAITLLVILLALSVIGTLSSGNLNIPSTSSSTSKAIALVKSGHFTDHENKTVGEAVDGFFSNPKWETGFGVDGETKGKMLVNARGGMTYMDKPVDAQIQFTVDMDNGTFQMNAFELNGIPQNQLMIVSLINKMFE